MFLTGNIPPGDSARQFPMLLTNSVGFLSPVPTAGLAGVGCGSSAKLFLFSVGRGGGGSIVVVSCAGGHPGRGALATSGREFASLSTT